LLGTHLGREHGVYGACTVLVDDKPVRSCLMFAVEGLIDMGSCALHDRLEPAEPHPDQFPNTGLSIRPFVDHREPLRLVRAQRQNDPPLGLI
jgi:hypothetical protein